MLNVPVVPLERITGRVRRCWEPVNRNPHMVVLGYSGAGKSYLIRHHILPADPAPRAVVIDIKAGGDPVWNGWGEDTDQLRPGFGANASGAARWRVRLLPGEAAKDQIRRVLELLAAEGETTLIIDDARKITDRQAPGLNLGNLVELTMLECRVIGLTFIIGAGSVAYLPPSLKDQPGFAWLGYTGYAEQRDEFAKIGGLPREARGVLDMISPRQWLYADHHGEALMLARSPRPS
jgi:hypothetical protein